MKKASVLLFLVFALTAFTPPAPAAGANIYWHFTFKAFPNLPDTNSVEWAWVTMVEYDRARAFPDEAAAARRAGGELQGTVMAMVKGAAWRSAHRYRLDTRCHDRPSKKDIFWQASESVSVYCTGSFYDPQPVRDGSGTVTLGPERFRFGFTNRRVLHENGRWEDLQSQVQVFTGGIMVEGGVREDTKGHFRLQVVNYLDNLEHHRRCEDAWVEQHNTAFDHFNHDKLEGDIPDVGEAASGQIFYGPHDRNKILWEVRRSTSREHPRWQQQAM